MYMLRNYATEHGQRAGGYEKNRHAILPLCSSKTQAYCLCTQTFALNAVVLRRQRLDVGTQEHVETQKRTAGTGTRDLRSAETPEYIKKDAGKINLLRTRQCR